MYQSFACKADIFKHIAVILQVQITTQKVTVEKNCYEG